MGSNPALLPREGSALRPPSRYKPVSVSRFFTGYYTNRNPLRSPLSAFYAEGWGLGKADALVDGLNVEISPALTIIRRPGFLPFSTATLPGPVLSLFSFHQIVNVPNPLDLIVDATVSVHKLTPTSISTIYTKATGAGTARFLGLANTLYIADGAQNQAWVDPATLKITPNPRNWGMQIGLFTGASGPNSPSVGTDVAATGGAVWSTPGNITLNTPGTNAAATVGGSGNITAGPTNAGTGATSGSPVWSNPSGVTSGGVSFATVQLQASGTSGALSGTGFGFAVPSAATINGIMVELYIEQASGTSAAYTVNLGLLNIGQQTTKGDAYGNSWPSVAGWRAYGGSSDLWGANPSPSQVNSSSFGASFAVNSTGGPGNGVLAECAGIRVTVYYTTTPTSVSDFLEGTGYGFNLSSTTSISGIQVTLAGLQGASNPAASSLTISLLKGGVATGTAKTGIQMPTAQGTVTLGGAGDLWGAQWGPSDFGSSFGIAIQALNPQNSTAATWSFNGAKITIWATGGPPISVTGTGSFSAKSGYSYAVAYGNSSAGPGKNTSGHLSSATPISAGTGVFSNAAGVQVSLTASTDAQVNQIWVFRTADGGSQWLNLPTSPYANSTANITDSAADSSLNVLQAAPLNHVNDPPPAGLTNIVYHAGRVWGSAGSTLYTSAGPDTTLGNGAEAWPPANFWVFPANIVRLLPTTSGLLIFMANEVDLMIGGPATIQYYPVRLLQGIGILNWGAVDTNGSQVFMFTSDQQLLTLDLSSAVTHLGFPIEDRLVLINPASASVAYHSYGNDTGLFVYDGGRYWYRAVPNPPVDAGIVSTVWSPPGQLASGQAAFLQSVETSLGHRQLLAAPALTGGTVMVRDSTYGTFSDNGTAYGAFMTIGSIVLAAPGQIAELGFITSEFVRLGSSPSVSVLLDEIAGSFQALATSISDPPLIYGSTTNPKSTFANRYYFKQTVGTSAPGPVLARHLQELIDFGKDTVKNELLSNTIWGGLMEEDAP